MSKIFLIHAAEREDTLRSIRSELQRSGFTVRGDELEIRADSPAAADLPESLLSTDAAVLVWSAHADASFVAHWLWTAALARGKPVIALLLDETPLPPALDVAAIPARRTPGEVASMVREILKTRTTPSKDESGGSRTDRFFSRWETRASLVAAALAIVTFGFDLPRQRPDPSDSPSGSPSTSAPKPPTPKQYPLAGLVWDEAGRPLPGVVVRVADHLIAMSDTTDESGRFAFEVLSDAPRQVNLTAEKDGYEPFNIDPALDSPLLEFVMRKIPP